MTGDHYDLAAIMEGAGKAGAGAAGGVPQGAALIGLVEAVLAGDETARRRARRAVREALGDAAFVDACATIASFDAVVKIADGTGIPLEAAKEAATRELRAQLSIDDLGS
jgi:hypothetical protein